MRELTIGKNEAGQRLDKFLKKYMREAPDSFIYKMIRKKNIVLNGKRTEGSEIIKDGDKVKLFLSDETIEKFSDAAFIPECVKNDERDIMNDTGAAEEPVIVYEDDDIILFNKPAGMLSQRAKGDEYSLVEFLIDHMITSGDITQAQLKTFRPSVCNRLDRNTSGIVAAGKSLAGSQFLSAAFRDRSVGKYYKCIVSGRIDEPSVIDGYLVKDDKTDRVTVTDAGSTEKPDAAEDKKSDARKPSLIITEYEPIKTGDRYTLLRVKLDTGKPHQIRAHLASIGHPILGDIKYGGERGKDFGLKAQLLHAYRLEFPEKIKGHFDYLSGRAFEADLPDKFKDTAVKLGLM